MESVIYQQMETVAMRKKIEGSFPFREINRLAMSEKIKKGHPGNIHLWWNRSPMESSAKMLEAVLEDELPGNQLEDTPSDVTILDPFSGSGCLALAAAGRGIPVLAGDINSVAAVITKAVVEVPYRFIDRAAVSSKAEIRLYSGLAGLAEDIRSYGEWVRDQLGIRLLSSYPEAVLPDADGKQVYAWIWTRTVPCPNPACNCTMPLATSYVISRQKGREYHVIPRVSKNGAVFFDLLHGAPETALNGNKIGKHGALFQCPNCGTITSDVYVKNAGISGKLGIQLMAVSYETANGRTYSAVENEQVVAAETTDALEPLIGDIPNNTRWFSPPLFGLKTYADLYTPRQLRLINTLFDLIGEVQEQCRKDAIDAGWQDDESSLEAGGAGALAYSQAVALYLSLAVSKMANYQSEMCTWDNRVGNIRATFTRQAIPMTWTFGEGNPFSSVTGNYRTMLTDVVTTVEKLGGHPSTRVEKMNALDYPFPKNSLLFTELPYYDNVGYSDLSDYFYVWLRRGLKGIFSQLFDQVVSSKEELSSIPEHFGGDAKSAVEFYDKGIHQLIQNFRKVATTEYPSVIFFEFSKQDEIALSSTSDKERAQSHWGNLLDALIQSGFQITATLPVRIELPNDRYDPFRIAVVFRTREEAAPGTTRRSFIAELRRDIPVQLRKRFQVDAASEDRPYVGMGCGLALFSRYARVMNADGSNMSVHDALQAIWTEVSQYLANESLDDNMKEETPNG